MSVEKVPRLSFTAGAGKDRYLTVQKRGFSTFPLHAHSIFELEIVLSGKGSQEIDGKTYRIEKGSAFLLSPPAFHRVTVTDDNATLYNISFEETAASVRLPLGKSYVCRSLSDDELAVVTDACELLIGERDTVAASLLLSFILRKICGGSPDSETFDPGIKAAEHANFHFREKLTVADGAAVACLSPVYFGALFAERMGCGYNEYVNRLRVECAERLLIAGMTVAEACYASGFGSLSAFGAVFRRQTGCSPSAYRRRSEVSYN